MTHSSGRVDTIDVSMSSISGETRLKTTQTVSENGSDSFYNHTYKDARDLMVLKNRFSATDSGHAGRYQGPGDSPAVPS